MWQPAPPPSALLDRCSTAVPTSHLKRICAVGQYGPEFENFYSECTQHFLPLRYRASLYQDTGQGSEKWCFKAEVERERDLSWACTVLDNFCRKRANLRGKKRVRYVRELTLKLRWIWGRSSDVDRDSKSHEWSSHFARSTVWETFGENPA